MNASLLSRLLFGLILIAAPLAASGAPSKADDKYRIAAILPLSGSAASLGNYVKNGLDLAYEMLPAEKRSKIELVYEDDKLSSANSISAFQRLKDQKGVKAVFVLGSGIGNALVPLTEKAGIVLVAIGASDGAVAKDKKFAFTHWVIPETEASAMSREIKRRGYRKIAIVSTEQEGAHALLVAVRAALKDRALSDRVVNEQIFLPAETDFRTYIAKLKSLETDCVVVLLFPGALASFAKQAQAMKLGADLAGIELFEDENEVKASEGALIGQWYVNADVAEKWLQKRYEDRFGQHPGWGVANAFDALHLVTDAAILSNGDNAAIAERLATLKNYYGAAGNYSATGDHRFRLPATIKVVEKDGFSKLERERP